MISPPSKTSSTYSPPLKSRLSKSKRIDPHDIGPMTKVDYVLLLFFYIGLYIFYAVFWFTLWRLYLLISPEDAPRRQNLFYLAQEELDSILNGSISISDRRMLISSWPPRVLPCNNST